MNKIYSTVARVLLLVVMLTLNGVNPVFSDIRYVERGPIPPNKIRNMTDWNHIVLDGVISKSDANQAEAILLVAQNKAQTFHSFSKVPKINAFLRSSGGNVNAAIHIGRLFRKYSVSTYVDSTCSSSCVIVFAGGVYRWIIGDGRLGVHRPRFEDDESFANLDKKSATTLYNQSVASIRSYFDDMGIDQLVARRMISVPSNRIEFVYESEATKLGLVGEDPGFSEWVRAREKQNVGPETLRAFDNYSQCSQPCGENKACADSCFARFLGPFVDKDGFIIKR